MKFKIVIVSSGQLSLNPRLVKEADALTAAGYEVIVLYAYWNDWGNRYDEQLLPEKKWKAILVGGDPRQQRFTWFLSRIIYTTCRTILKKTGNFNYVSEFAVARSSYFLIKAAKKYKADLYIGHNLGALPAIVKTAKLYKKPSGFDAEDFHRQEVTDDANSFHFKMCKYIEDKYLPSVDYLTASSPLISENYSALYHRKVTCILNVFPKTQLPPISQSDEIKPLKLFWFSQTIGPCRGLEMIIEAMGIKKMDAELHLLGKADDAYKNHLLQLAQDAGLPGNAIFFYEPVRADAIFNLATQFDIGLASETGFCLNNNMALSNKIFTYLQSGLAVAVSSTHAQKAFIEEYPQIGKIYRDANELSIILNEYNENRELLFKTKKAAFTAGQTLLNWENEGQAFLNVVKEILIKN